MKIGFISLNPDRSKQIQLLNEGHQLRVWWPTKDGEVWDEELRKKYGNQFTAIRWDRWDWEAIIYRFRLNDLVIIDAKDKVPARYIDYATDIYTNFSCPTREILELQNSQELVLRFAVLYGLENSTYIFKGMVGKKIFAVDDLGVPITKVEGNLAGFFAGLERFFLNANYRGPWSFSFDSMQFSTDPYFEVDNLGELYAQACGLKEIEEPLEIVSPTSPKTEKIRHIFFYGGEPISKSQTIYYDLLLLEWLTSENWEHVTYTPRQLKALLKRKDHGFYLLWDDDRKQAIGHGIFRQTSKDHVYGKTVGVLNGYGPFIGLKFMRYIHDHMKNSLDLHSKNSLCLESAIAFHLRLGYKIVTKPTKEKPWYQVRKIF